MMIVFVPELMDATIIIGCRRRKKAEIVNL